MRFAFFHNARLRFPVSSYGLAKASLERETGDRDGLGIDRSGRDTEDRATRLELRMAERTVATLPRRNGNYARSVLKYVVPCCDV
jgi:hypothetical protein